MNDCQTLIKTSSPRLQLEETFNPPLEALSWADLRQFLYQNFSPAIYRMDIQSIYLFLWLKILLSEKLVERCTGVSFHSLLHLVSFPSATERQPAAFCTLHYCLYELFTFCGARLILLFPLCPWRSESQTEESIAGLVIRSWVPTVWIQYWLYCWSMLPLLYNNIFCCCPLPQLSVPLNSLRLYIRYKILSIHLKMSGTRKSLKKRLLLHF